MATSKPQPAAGVKKRKAGPWLDEHKSTASPTHKRTKRQQNVRDARTLATQTSSSAFRNGELNLDKFVKAREFEIRALEQGLQRSKNASTTRAFQQVPKDLRRRTASHNAKRVPKRLQPQARREMADDNTPVVNAKSKKTTGRMRLRLDNADRLRALSRTQKSSVQPTTTKSKVHQPQHQNHPNELRKPPVPKRKFRKRQIKKSWLPTHMYHTKRAKMTPPDDPLWRFSIPITPSLKSYRPTHRAASEHGAIAWDTSYMSTILLAGHSVSILALLAALGHVPLPAAGQQRWYQGSRSWHGWLRTPPATATHSQSGALIGPVTIIWQPQSQPQPSSRAAFVRSHPSAFHLLWHAMVTLAATMSPEITVEDLRFDIGSIEITGSAACEAMQSALWPYQVAQEAATKDGSVTLWQSLKAVQNPAVCFPSDIIIPLDIIDPRLRFPPRPIDIADREQPMLITWPLDAAPAPSRLFDLKARRVASRSLPAQRTINRRKAASQPGQFPSPTSGDPPIPCLIFVQRALNSPTKRVSWTVLLPWKCVQPVWYSLTYYPLSTGGQVRFGGLREQRQLTFEAGTPWFPADFPGTQAGDDWEVKESVRRKAEWERRPKGKRTNFESVNLNGTVGEIGRGWACDWQVLTGPEPNGPRTDSAAQADNAEHKKSSTDGTISMAIEHNFIHLLKSLALPFFRPPYRTLDAHLTKSLVTVRVTLLTRGVPDPCARIYRLPTNSPDLRERWLALSSTSSKSNTGSKKHTGPARTSIKNQESKDQSNARIARELLLGPEQRADSHPSVPDKSDLIGFVTTGEFSLAEGKGIGIGSLLLSRVLPSSVTDAQSLDPSGKSGDDSSGPRGTEMDLEMEDALEATPGSKERVDGKQNKAPMRHGSARADRERYLCIVRNAGETVGRLARWQLV